MKPRVPPSMLAAIRRRMAEGWTPPIAGLIGFRLTEIGRGRATVELEVGPQHSNPMGTLHGGVVCDVADAAMGMAYASLLRADVSFATVEVKVNFLKPVWAGRLVAKGRMLKAGRTLGLAECRVVDQDGALVAFATSTLTTLGRDQGDGLTRSRRRP